jgi:hypothetical protein
LQGASKVNEALDFKSFTFRAALRGTVVNASKSCYRLILINNPREAGIPNSVPQ